MPEVKERVSEEEVQQQHKWLKGLGRKLEGARARECRREFFAEYLKIRDKRGALVPLVPNESQREFERHAGRRNIVLKARQVGITTWVGARFFLATIASPGSMTVQVAHDHSSAEAIFRIVHRFLENLPEAMRKGALKTSRANVRQIRFGALDSEYRVESAADLNAGRGLTIHNLHCSEVARWPREAVEALTSLRAAVVPGGEIVLESTPKGAGGCFYDEWQKADETGYVRHFFPWWMEPSYARPARGLAELEAGEEALVRAHGLTREQIVFRREIWQQFGKRAPQEFAEDAESCFLASGECLFDLEAIERQLRECVPPERTEDHGRLQIWLAPTRNGEYVVGVDPAGGGMHGDYACAEVIERQTGLQCAELHGHLSPRELAPRLASLARKYNDAMVAVERNNHGHAVLVFLRDLHGYEHLYRQKGEDGWLTTSLTRPEMIDRLVATVDQRPGLFQSERFLRECRTFLRRADGSGEAAGGAHDDCVMAMAMAHAVRRQGGNKPVRSVTDRARGAAIRCPLSPAEFRDDEAVGAERERW